MAPKTSTFFDLKTCLGKSYRHGGWYSPADLKERLFTNKSKRPGDDLKEALRTDDDTIAWQAWNVAHDLIWQSCRPGPPLVFPGEKELFTLFQKLSLLNAVPGWVILVPPF